MYIYACTYLGDVIVGSEGVPGAHMGELSAIRHLTQQQPHHTQPLLHANTEATGRLRGFAGSLECV